MDKLTIRAFMTPAPITIAVDRTLADAQGLMRQHQIRHLPVVDGERLVGIVSERDLALAAGARGFEGVPVSDVMTREPRALSPHSSLEWAAAEMAQRKIGAMVVVEHGRLEGIFTTVDALRALGELLGRARRRRARRQPLERH